MMPFGLDSQASAVRRERVSGNSEA